MKASAIDGKIGLHCPAFAFDNDGLAVSFDSLYLAPSQDLTASGLNQLGIFPGNARVIRYACTRHVQRGEILIEDLGYGEPDIIGIITVGARALPEDYTSHLAQ